MSDKELVVLAIQAYLKENKDADYVSEVKELLQALQNGEITISDWR